MISLRQVKHTKFINFYDQNIEFAKHKSYAIVNNKTEEQLAVIGWSKQWNKFCIFPGKNTFYDSKCLLEIVQFIQQLDNGELE